jgi:hypothetical protein
MNYYGESHPNHRHYHHHIMLTDGPDELERQRPCMYRTIDSEDIDAVL